MSCCSCRTEINIFYNLEKSQLFPSITIYCQEHDIISLRWKAVKFYFWSNTQTHFSVYAHTPWCRCFANKHERVQGLRAPTHTHIQSWVCDRWRRLIASALHHEWQQEVVSALLKGGRGNEHVGYLSSSLMSFPLLWFAVCFVFIRPVIVLFLGDCNMSLCSIHLLLHLFLHT